MSKPRNWPDALPYLKAPLHGKDLTKAQIEALRSRPSSSISSSEAIPIAPASATETPSKIVKIQAINDPTHPAHGQYGLFATENLAPGTLILAYLGRVHNGSAASSSVESDYDLWIEREANVAVDAAREGNEGRFVNDFRGVKSRANARFGNVWCERWREICVGIWVMGKNDGSEKKKGGIKKGEEILVSYGKGFWDERRNEVHGED